MTRRTSSSALLPLATALLAGLAASPATARTPESFKVLAVPSLSGAFSEMAASCCDSSGAGAPRIEYAPGSVIEKRIQQGEHIDVIALSDAAPLEALWHAGKVGPPRRIARDLLALIVPAGDSAMTSYIDLSRPGLRIASADPATDLGLRTDQLLVRIRGMRRNSGTLVNSIRTNLSRRESGSQAIFDRLERGQADAGIVYAADLEAGGSKVRTLLLPDSMSPQIELFVATVAAGEHRKQAESFASFAAGDAGQKILRRHGFLQ